MKVWKKNVKNWWTFSRKKKNDVKVSQLFSSLSIEMCQKFHWISGLFNFYLSAIWFDFHSPWLFNCVHSFRNSFFSFCGRFYILIYICLSWRIPTIGKTLVWLLERTKRTILNLIWEVACKTWEKRHNEKKSWSD